MNQIKSVNRVFLATVIISVLGSFINVNVLRITENYAYIMILSQIIIVLPSVFYLIIKKINIVSGIRLNKINLGNVILIILFTYLITPLMGLINLLSTRVVSNSTVQILSQITSENSFLLSLILVALVPCILEETVYRGIFYNEYRKVNVLKGIFLSGFLFGIMHGNFNQFSYAFAMGIIFALLIEATNSILSTMIVHFFINGTSVFGLYLLPKLDQIMKAVYGDDYTVAADAAAGTEINTSVIVSYAIYAAVATTLAFIVFRTIAKRTGRWDYIKGIFKHKKDDLQTETYINKYTDESIDENRKVQGTKKLVTVSLLVAIIICFVLMILNEVPIESIF
jgi:uncharacterized protein